MAGRIPWQSNLDPTAHREEELTLSRMASQRSSQPPAFSSSSEMLQRSIEKVGNTNSATVQRRRFVFADPVAFRYLEDDAATVVLERHGRLEGYELYLVEQWACSRIHPTFVITAFTGDINRAVVVGVLGVPVDESIWSPRLRVYFKAISQFHARPRETPLGMLMVTNLSGFPSALTVIPVPDGDIRKHREDFIVNENLKRLGCSGRSGMGLSTPAGATQAKFHQLYRTSDRIPLYRAVIELVKLCQVALMIFGQLEQEYADGLLCDVTEKAITDWWTEIGSEYYNIEPNDGILGPTTVAALLGMLMGARNRLNYYGAPVAKDVFDIVNLKRGIAHFQKSQKLERTRRLDRQTLERLHRVTAKAAASEGWAVPKAVKSTVAELSGKGGDMVMGIVGGARDKSTMADVETLDMDRFVTQVHGERSKWLWYGKSRRGGAEQFGKSLPELGNMIFSKDDQGGYVWSNKRPDTEQARREDDFDRHRDLLTPMSSTRSPGFTNSIFDSSTDKEQSLRRNVFKNKMNDARSGFGRIKDAIGVKGHSSRPSKDEADFYGNYSSFPNSASPNVESGSTNSGSPFISKAFTWKNKPEEYMNGMRRDPEFAASVSQLRESESPQLDDKANPLSFADSMPNLSSAEDVESNPKWPAQVQEIRDELVTNGPSIVGSVVGDGDLEGPLLEAERDPDNNKVLLYRRNSIATAALDQPYHRHGARWPRHMSFSNVEEVILSWTDIGAFADDGNEDDTWDAYVKQQQIAADCQRLYEKIQCLELGEVSWVGNRIGEVEDLDNQAARDQEEFLMLYGQLHESYTTFEQNARDIMAEERSHITEAVKDVEVLGAKLDYEINGLVSKVEDLEDGIRQFEAQVLDVESRATELESLLNAEGWLHWIMRSVMGLSKQPSVPL